MLIQGNPGTGCAAQKPFEMEARELISRIVNDVRREGCHGARIGGIQQRESVLITARF
jgi:hypothetical protein